MPRISAFFGIIIWMYYNDHQPPHFHAEYAGEEVLILIGSGEIFEGRVSRRALRLVQEAKVMQRRAQWLLGRVDRLFPDEPAKNELTGK